MIANNSPIRYGLYRVMTNFKYQNSYLNTAIELKMISSDTNQSYSFPGQTFVSASNPSLKASLNSQNLTWLNGNKITLPASVFQGKHETNHYLFIF